MISPTGSASSPSTPTVSSRPGDVRARPSPRHRTGTPGNDGLEQAALPDDGESDRRPLLRWLDDNREIRASPLDDVRLVAGAIESTSAVVRLRPRGTGSSTDPCPSPARSPGDRSPCTAHRRGRAWPGSCRPHPARRAAPMNTTSASRIAGKSTTDRGQLPSPRSRSVPPALPGMAAHAAHRRRAAPAPPTARSSSGARDRQPSPHAPRTAAQSMTRNPDASDTSRSEDAPPNSTVIFTSSSRHQEVQQVRSGHDALNRGPARLRDQHGGARLGQQLDDRIRRIGSASTVGNGASMTSLTVASSTLASARLFADNAQSETDPTHRSRSITGSCDTSCRLMSRSACRTVEPGATLTTAGCVAVLAAQDARPA